jgi:multiple sugar transport system permease protein
MGELLLSDEKARRQGGRRRSTLYRYQALMAYLFISPALILFFIFSVLPALMALWLSFTDYDILSPPRWVGLQNYARMLGDNLFHTSLLNVARYALMFVPTMLVLSLGLALALNRRLPAMGLFRTVYYLPVVSSSIAASVVWIWLLNTQYGLVNQLLAAVGINGPGWLSDSDWAMVSIVFVTLWQGIGSNMVIYLAGLQGIPPTLYEAAMLDGADSWQRFRYITLPALRTTTFFVSTLSLIGAFQLFEQAYVMTDGGPGNATRTAVYHIYKVGFDQLRMGYASTLAFTLFLIILAVSLLNIRLNREESAF